jgi:hypothetical protein
MQTNLTMGQKEIERLKTSTRIKSGELTLRFEKLQRMMGI